VLRNLIIFSIALLTSSSILAQADSLGFSIAPQFGFIVPHRESMKHLITGHCGGLHATIWKQTKGHKSWETDYRFPKQGLTFLAMSTGNPDQLGYQYAGMYSIELSLKRANENGQIDLHPRFPQNSLLLALGGGYATKIWDLRDNHQADALGSHFNVSLLISHRIQLLRTKSHACYFSVTMAHLSNGAFQLPNLGTNTFTAGLGYSFVGKSARPLPNAQRSIAAKAWEFTSSAGIGFKEIPPFNGKKHAIGIASAAAERQFSSKSGFLLQVDAMYNSSLRLLMEQRESTSVSADKTLQVGLTAGYVLHFNRAELRMMQGVYLKDQYKTDGSLYHRFVFRYHLTPRIFAQLALKTHYAKADYGEIGLGWRWRK
jgi:hypothetical protein